MIDDDNDNETVKGENKDNDDASTSASASASASTNDNDNNNDNDDGAVANDEPDDRRCDHSREYYRNGNTTVSQWFDHLRKWIPLILINLFITNGPSVRGTIV